MSAATTVAAATTVEATASAVKATATSVEATTSVKSAAGESVGYRTMADEATSAGESASAHEPASAPKASPTESASAEARTEKAPAVEARPTEPGTCTDEHSAGKPVRPVVTIGRAGIRVVSIVAVSARGWSGVVARSPTQPNRDLRLRIGQRHHQNRQQRHILEISHCEPPVQIRFCQLQNRPDLKVSGFFAAHRRTYLLELSMHPKVATCHWLISARGSQIQPLAGEFRIANQGR